MIRISVSRDLRREKSRSCVTRASASMASALAACTASGTAQARDDDLALRYSELALQYGEVFSSWRVIALDYDIACRAAALRAMYRLKLDPSSLSPALDPSSLRRS